MPERDEWGGVEIDEDEFGGVAVAPPPEPFVAETSRGGKPLINVPGQTFEPALTNPVPVSGPQPDLEKAFWEQAHPQPFWDTPLLKPEVAVGISQLSSEGFNRLPLPESLREMQRGSEESVGQMVSGMTTPKSIAMLPAFAIPYVGPALAAGYGAGAAGAGAGRTVAGIEQGNPREIGGGLTETAGGLSMMIPGAAHSQSTLRTLADPTSAALRAEIARGSDLTPAERAEAGRRATNLAAPGTVRPGEIEAVGPPGQNAPPMFELGEMPFEAAPRFGTTKIGEPQVLPQRGFLPPPEILEETRPKQELETRGKVSFGAEAPTLLRTAIQTAEDVGLKKSAAQAAKIAVEKEPNASKDTSATTLHGDVFPLETPASELPAQESQRGILPQAGGGIPGTEGQKAQPKVSLTPVLETSDGKLYPGISHSAALKEAMAGLPTGKISPEDFGKVIEASQNDAQHKFLTSDGRVLDRAQAGAESGLGGNLQSEDLAAAGLLKHLEEPKRAPSLAAKENVPHGTLPIPEKQPAPATERIVAVAVRDPKTGEITSAPNKIHVELFREAKIPVASLKGAEIEAASGFLTDTGRFVTREEANQIGESQGMIAKGGELMGEDVAGRQAKIAGRPTTPEPAKPVEGAGAAPAPAEPMAGMGGATPEEFGDPNRPTQLAAITEYLAKGPELSPKLPLRDRIAKWVDMANAWAKGKDAVTGGLAKARAASAALLDSYLHLPAWDSFEHARGLWSGADNRSGLEVRNFVKAINHSIPNRLRQEAITNWIQADGDPALLRTRAAASGPDVRPGYEAALTLTPDEKVVARNIQGYLETRLQEGIDAGILKQGVDNYVTQIWKRENPATSKLNADLFGDGRLNPNFKYAKQRVFSSYFDGEQAGFKPKDKSIGQLMGAYDLAFNKALSSRAFIKALHEGSAKDGMPITMIGGKSVPVPSGGPAEAFLIKPRQAPNGAVTADGRPYRVVDHWALRDWKWATTGPDGQPVLMQGDMLVHPDYYQQVKNMLGTSALTSRTGLAAYTSRPLLQASALAKQTKLSLSLFHLTQEGVHGIFHRVNPANLVELDLANPLQRGLVDHGLQISDPRAAELFGEGLAGGGLTGKIPGIGHIQNVFNDFLFKDYIPQLKMTMALDALERNRKAYAKDIAAGKITDDQLQALTAREGNAAFGELNYRMMGRNPTVQDFLRAGFLAPDFLEARGRFVAQALKPFGKEQRMALGLMGATLYVTARILNQYLDDKPNWDKPFSVIYKGREYRLRTVLGDVQHLFQDPRMFGYNRLSPLARAAIESATGRDDRGMKRTSMEQLKDLASWAVPIPLQSRSDTTIGQQVLGSTGVATRKYGPVQQVYEWADNWKKQSKDPKVREQLETYQRETHPDSPYKPLRDAIEKGDEKAARQAMVRLRETRLAGTIREGLQQRPFTGSDMNERKFLQTLTDEQRAIYRQAMDERRRIAREGLKYLRESGPGP